ncbi:MAG TPA: tyrosine-type recombinase/integrase [Opitutaceae bacterium]|nr:tyrosine-type recombinase/integrase [Opitutaceae bacterium]
MFRRGQVFYCEDTTTRQQVSLRTRDRGEALTLLHTKNEAYRQPLLNLQIARTYISATDPEIGKRTWQAAMDEMGKTKTGPTLIRHHRAMLDQAFDLIRNRPILETQPSQLQKVLSAGTVSTNIFLRRIHNFALDMGWLPWPILVKKRWPKIQFKEKRAVTFQEHQRIIEDENNPERRAYYECCWHLGGSQTDVAQLNAEDIDWETHVIGFCRKKTGTVSMIRFGSELERVLRSLPSSGPLFPHHRTLLETHRAKEFWRRCARVGVSGVTLHSYRYAWAERARTFGYPERFAQEALGHASKAVHRAYSKKAQVVIPPLEDYERRAAANGEAVIVPMPVAMG